MASVAPRNSAAWSEARMARSASIWRARRSKAAVALSVSTERASEAFSTRSTAIRCVCQSAKPVAPSAATSAAIRSQRVNPVLPRA